jgi:zinc/manganese transport system substrate-binding protein
VKRLLAIGLTASLLLSLAACTGFSLPTEPRHWSRGHGPINIVATTNVWADLAYEIGGKFVTAHAIIYNITQDPHSYEATPRDQLLVNQADLVFENGGGYDDFMTQLTKNSDRKDAPVLNAVKIAGTRADGNEHIWFSIERVRKIASAIAEKLKSFLPASDTTSIDENVSMVDAKLDALEKTISNLKPKMTGKKVIFAEPVAAYLADELGVVDATPIAFSRAVEEGRDIPPAAANQVKQLLASGQIKLVIYSSATVGSQAQKIFNTNQQHVPAVEIGELLLQDPDTFEWTGDYFTYLSSAIKSFEFVSGGAK